MDTNLSNELSYLFQEVNRAKMQLTAMKFQADMPSKTPGQKIGNPIPSREGGTVVIPSGSLQLRHQVNVVISSDGPFFAKSIHFNFKYMDNGYWWNTHDFPIGFYWGYSVSGSERQRQNTPVPSSMIERSETGGAGFFELVPQDAFPKSSTVTIWMSFIEGDLNVVNPGGMWNIIGDRDLLLWVGFNGFYVLG